MAEHIKYSLDRWFKALVAKSDDVYLDDNGELVFNNKDKEND
jgi:hypothetical protein|tara:strand:+ start:367 stop:492 length:126 start_codon:yes stop_codon:yes gene_type:complete